MPKEIEGNERCRQGVRRGSAAQARAPKQNVERFDRPVSHDDFAIEQHCGARNVRGHLYRKPSHFKIEVFG